MKIYKWYSRIRHKNPVFFGTSCSFILQCFLTKFINYFIKIKSCFGFALLGDSWHRPCKEEDKEEESCNKTDQKIITDLGIGIAHVCVDPLQLLHGEVVVERDHVIVPLKHLGLVIPDSGGDTWSFSAHFISILGTGSTVAGVDVPENMILMSMSFDFKASLMYLI